MVLPDRNKMKAVYEKDSHVRSVLTHNFGYYVEKIVSQLSPRPMVKARPKSFNSYFKKYLRYLRDKNGHYLRDKNDEADPVQEVRIPDQVGARVICIFLEDVGYAEKVIRDNFEVLETEHKGASFSFKEFGYVSRHLLVKIPKVVLRKTASICSEENISPDYAEIQIRTILQDAWAEVEHELVYKAGWTPFDGPMKRKLAALNASLSLADTIFQEIREYQRQLNGQLDRRRDTFYQKIEESTWNMREGLSLDESEKAETLALPFEDMEAGAAGITLNEPVSGGVTPKAPEGASSIDEMLLNGLYAHNKGNFAQAVALYTQILEMGPSREIAALIYKHRGMANFAQSMYEDALSDFSTALTMDSGAYRVAYYRGVVHAVLGDWAAALVDYGISLAINPYQDYCLYRRAQVYYHMEDYPAALSDCEAAIKLSTGFESAAKLRKMLHEKLKM
jgi:putative GTP pyrophosphokinase